MSTAEQAERSAAIAGARARRLRAPRPSLAGTWWRHLIAVFAVALSLFPVAYMASAAFSADGTLSGASLIPRDLTLDNFRTILSGTVTVAGEPSDIPYPRWYANSMFICFATAILTVMLGALAAYAFSRFRFRGRRIGMLTLLLIQMFPQLLAVVAIYLIVLETGDVFPILGLNSYTALIVVYLGGAMGVNAWLLKGFFDTIPAELDESARVDGATPSQVFWGVVLPLAAPVLAVVGLFSFVATLNEYVIVSTLMQTRDHFTLPVGMRQFIDKQYAEQWGVFCAGVLLAAIPVVVIFQFLQRLIVAGLTQGSVKG
ncbi:MAG TPA: ABC transporter permease subunit [Gaiellaceae bacterium]|nr:ABC transporter permease subunit [Gaiellaceae bacterium]